ncbi:hypothetical protein [Paraburkholderia sp. MM5384-R2]|uniref:hypothetical protein n=1 Tax=Paraburkholderia sp. MM5384-R2 TaxID=2723097 RepID=UPI00161131EA|nr:hypothetical protein [Paraburkholderia sp. MM5384-R2]
MIERAQQLLAETPRMPKHIAARRAQQEMLEPNRWRKFKQHKNVEKLLPATVTNATIEDPPRRYPRAIEPAPPLREKPVADGSSADYVPPVSTETAEAGAQPVANRSPTVDPSIVRAVAEHVIPMLATTVDECLRQLVGAVTIAFQNHAIQPGTASAHVAHPKVAPPTRTRLPRVCVVGLINQQGQDVAAAFDGAIDFVFVKAQRTGGGGHGGAGMLTKGSSADVVLAMTDFIGHDVEASAKHLHVPFERVKGSVSALTRWLTEWLATGVRH